MQKVGLCGLLSKKRNYFLQHFVTFLGAKAPVGLAGVGLSVCLSVNNFDFSDKTYKTLQNLTSYSKL